MRLDAFLARHLGVSRAVAAGLVAATRVDGRSVAARYRLRAGQRVDVPEAPPPATLRPEPGPVRVVYEDEEVIVVDKEAGVVVHPGAGVATGTLAARLLHRFPELAGVGDPARPGIVHRLDRDTSGLLCVARTPDALARLQDALRQHQIRRDYLALVSGVPDVPRGAVDAPIGPDPARPGRRVVTSSGRPARTHYEVRARWESPPRSLLEVRLETGRTHQIHVHLAAVGLPVVGDAVYGRGGRGGAALPGVERGFLHAFRLGLPGRPPLESPLPPDLAAALAGLGPPAP